MNQRIEEVSKWFYHGVWGILSKWFRVPKEPPQLPTMMGESIQSFRPSPEFLRYLKLQFWVALMLIDGCLLFVWLAMFVGLPWLGAVVTPLALFLMVAPTIVAYLAIHLRYDTTWYVMSDRSLRIRRGIWIIHETTITFENVQNVAVNQGPLQRLFHIADVTVQTAGGGSGMHGKEGASTTGAHHGLIEGVDNAQDIRDLIMSRLNQSRTAGLGDEVLHASVGVRSPWSPAHLAMLREISAAAKQLASRRQA